MRASALEGPGAVDELEACSAAGDVEQTAAELEPILHRLARSRDRADACGAPLAATYLEGAADAVAHALDVLWHVRSSADRTRGGCVLDVGSAEVTMAPTGVGPYATAIGCVSRRAAGRPGVAIGASLAGSPGLTDLLRADDLAAGLMTAALAHHDWLHLETDEAFAGDPLAAAAIVATLTGRTDFPRWTRARLRGLLDRRSADVLNALGWRRMTGPGLPAAA